MHIPLPTLIVAVQWTRILRSWGGVGLVPLGIADSSLIPTFGSLDVLTVLLSAKHRDLWLYYAAMSTIGSLLGAYLTYRLGHKAGASFLDRKLGHKRSEQVRRLIDRWGLGGILVPTIAPPPFPTTPFFAAAGAFNYPLRNYLSAVAVGRIVRYGTLAFVGAHYGRHILRFLRHPQRYLMPSILVTVVIAVVIVALVLFWRSAQEHTEAASESVMQSNPPRQS
ncbi:MAG TPA: VTT domain-containing protein [Terriglobales bacterium]|nr:VTT domain-containing protein [Terriglobales bacterium]